MKRHRLDDKEKITDLEAVTVLKKGYGMTFQEASHCLKMLKNALSLAY